MPSSAQEKIWTRDFALMFGSTMLFWSAFLFFLPTLSIFMVQRLGSSPAQVGLISGLTALTAIAARPIAGFALDRWGRRWVYLGALLSFSAATFAYLLVDDLASLTIVRLLFGVPFGFATVASMTVAGDLAPPGRRGEAMGIFALAQMVSTAVGPFAALAVLGQGQFPRLFIVTGSLALAAVLLGWPVRYSARRDPKATLRPSAVLERQVAPVAMTVLFQGLVHGGIVTFLPLYALQIRVANIGLFYVAFATGQVVARAFAGKAFDRRGPRSVVVGGLALAAGACATLSLWDALAGVLVAGLIYGLGWALSLPSLQTMALEQVAPPRRGAASATFCNGMDVGVFLGSNVMAAVAQTLGGYDGMFLVSAGILAIPVALFLAWALPIYRPWRADAGGGKQDRAAQLAAPPS